MMCDVTECQFLQSGYCDLIHRAELCATYRISQPEAAKRLKNIEHKHASRARKADADDPIVRTYPVEAIVYANRAARMVQGLPRFLADAHIRSRAKAWRMTL